MRSATDIALVVLLWACALLSACESGGEVPDAVPPDVTPHFVPGDTFEVTVFEEEELSGEFQVQEDGSIDYPLVGRIKVSGLTQGEVQHQLEELLRDGYLVNPQVRVNVLERQNLEVSVLGEVKKPGSFPYVDKLTLVQAVSNAGGTTEMANPRKVRLTRPSPTGTKVYEVSLKDITTGKRNDIVLLPGDIVYVPESPI